MASRNARRKAAQQRLEAKSQRIANAERGRFRDEVKAIVADNLSKPIERNYYPQSIMGSFAGKATQGRVTRAQGSMNQRSVTSIMAKVANRKEGNYARPNDKSDRSLWPVK